MEEKGRPSYHSPVSFYYWAVTSVNILNSNTEYYCTVTKFKH